MPSRSDPFIRVPANLEAVRDLAAWAQGACSDAGVADDIALELELALVEAATNIVVHAMPGEGDADAVGENVLRSRCRMPTGRTNSGASMRRDTSRPSVTSCLMVRSGKMLMPEPITNASLII